MVLISNTKASIIYRNSLSFTLSNSLFYSTAWIGSISGAGNCCLSPRNHSHISLPPRHDRQLSLRTNPRRSGTQCHKYALCDKSEDAGLCFVPCRGELLCNNFQHLFNVDCNQQANNVEAMCLKFT
jgi:hypothetical protein